MQNDVQPNSDVESVGKDKVEIKMYVVHVYVHSDVMHVLRVDVKQWDVILFGLQKFVSMA